MAYVATPLKARGMDWIFADNEGQATGCLKRLRLDGITLPEKEFEKIHSTEMAYLCHRLLPPEITPTYPLPSGGLMTLHG